MAEMKPIELQEKTVDRLWLLYRGAYPHMLDIERSYVAFNTSLVDHHTQMFEGPGGMVFLIRDMYLPHGNASVYILPPDGIPQDLSDEMRDEVRDGLRRVMDLFDLYRLFAVTPSEIVGAFLHLLGFVQEGALREAYLVDGERKNIPVYSILKKDLDGRPEEKPREGTSDLIRAAGLSTD